MSRIASGLLIAAAALAMTGLPVRPTLAAEATPLTAKVLPGRAGEGPQVLETREGSRVLALIVALKALQVQARA
jgi:hypothetical protein